MSFGPLAIFSEFETAETKNQRNFFPTNISDMQFMQKSTIHQKMLFFAMAQAHKQTNTAVNELTWP